ncbi:hypothetical protein EJ06DRAFT_558819 [Trichodelitschia bisporula]|uniref:Uncharacterized protein n=1 Tax=Trichodelitschia bisporula TaxID=703511 RepID=A0A6G1HPD3_9PEZI|nr:hypothetical protein EJ06DRAFT_558819 [Trichodelitschia bisporula]
MLEMLASRQTSAVFAARTEELGQMVTNANAENARLHGHLGALVSHVEDQQQRLQKWTLVTKRMYGSSSWSSLPMGFKSFGGIEDYSW